MAIQARKLPDELVFAAVTSLNLLTRAWVGGSTTYPHADITSTRSGGYQAPTTSALLVTAASATDLPTTITLAENCRTVLLTHMADAGGAQNLYGGAHKAADATNNSGISYGTLAKIPSATGTLMQVEALLNALKTACNAHVSQSGVHFTNDGTNTVSAANATDLPSSETLANAIKTFVNAHVQFAGSAMTVQTISA